MAATEELVELSEAPLRAVRFWRPELEVERRRDGTVYVRQKGRLPPYPARLTERLAHWAALAPERPYLADRGGGGGWRTLSYGETLARVRRLGQALLDLGLSAERPLVILSENDLEHALLNLAATHVGVPFAPVSPAYSLLSADFAKLREIMALLKPGLIFAADGARFRPALEAVAPADAALVFARNPLPGRRALLFDDLLATAAREVVEAAHARVAPDSIVKIMFTSGSTGAPKGVICTQRMLCANQAMVLDCYAYMADEPPVVLDWAPWHHTASGSKVFNMVLYNGGTFYLDDGRPTPELIGRTVLNLREISPTWYFNVPKGYDELVARFERDRALRECFFRDLKMMMYAGAALAQHTWDALARLALATAGERILLATGLGATETAPFAMMCTTEQKIAGNVGVPARELELKLVPAEGVFEARMKGPNITPGYFGAPELTAQAFDEEGFYRLGDALRFAEPADAAKGFYFAGRLAENFKLSTGVWVAVGQLRARFIDHFGPLVRDVVIAAPDRAFLGALVFPNEAACRDLAGLAAETPLTEALAEARVRAAFRDRLGSFAESATGSSNRVERLILCAESPSMDRGEATDKGSLNQRAVLRQRADLVEALYAGAAPVIALHDPTAA